MNLILLVIVSWALQIAPVGCIFAYLKFIALRKIILKAEGNDNVQTLARIKNSGEVLPRRAKNRKVCLC